MTRDFSVAKAPMAYSLTKLASTHCSPRMRISPIKIGSAPRRDHVAEGWSMRPLGHLPAHLPPLQYSYLRVSHC